MYWAVIYNSLLNAPVYQYELPSTPREALTLMLPWNGVWFLAAVVEWAGKRSAGAGSDISNLNANWDDQTQIA